MLLHRRHIAGSSPRVRGKLALCWDKGRRLRLIPACAGKTTSLEFTRLRAWAHPRVCGENESTASPQRLWAGSSPRVRGKPVTDSISPRRRGLIPACAGKTSRSRRLHQTLRAHPRVCGENFWTDLASDGSHGSSPRVRGKLAKPWDLTDRDGLIPACAGKTCALLG